MVRKRTFAFNSCAALLQPYVLKRVILAPIMIGS